MNKVFLLLRQNIQSGPYTFDELLQQKLQPNDLIWMEGKSANWFNPDDLWQYLKQNPQQLAAPKEESAATPTPTAAAIPLAKAKELTPEIELEQRAEEIRKRALAYAASTPPPKIKVEHTSSRSRTIHIADENIEFTYHKRSGVVTAPQLLVAGIVTAFLVGVVYLGWSPINSKKHQVSGVAVPAGNTVVQEPQPQAMPAVAMEESTTTANALIVDPVFAEAPISVAKESAPKKQAVTKETPLNKAPAVAEVKETPPVKEEASVTTTAPPAAITEAEPKAEAQKETAVTTTETADKKKTLGQVIKGIFKKKNKGEDKEEAVSEN